jgi:hypothetical protein
MPLAHRIEQDLRVPGPFFGVPGQVAEFGILDAPGYSLKI